MIVITKLNETPRRLFPGDRFCLTVCDLTGFSVVIEEEITVEKVIDFIASFRFTLEDGTCPGFHLMGVFACKSDLPQELRDATHINDLTPEQLDNFTSSIGVKLSE